MKTLKYFLGICLALCFVACENDEEIVIPQDKQANEIVEKENVSNKAELEDSFNVKKAFYIEDSDHIEFDITEAFGSQSLTLKEKIREGKVMAVAVYAKESTLPPASGASLRLMLINDTGFRTYLGGCSSMDHIMLICKEKGKNTVDFYYDCSSPDPATVEIIDGKCFLKSCPFGVVMDNVQIHVVFATDFIPTGDGYRYIYESSPIEIEDLEPGVVSDSWYQSIDLYPK